MKYIVARFIIILLSLFCIDGGKTYLLFSYSEQIIVYDDHNNDMEPMCHDHSVNLAADEKWVNTVNPDLVFPDRNIVTFLKGMDSSLPDLPDSIWQPPKFV